MPRDGALTLSDLVGKLNTLRIACERCERSGQYRVDRLIARYGGDQKLPDWIREVTADCTIRVQGETYSERCRAICPDLPKVL